MINNVSKYLPINNLLEKSLIAGGLSSTLVRRLRGDLRSFPGPCNVVKIGVN